LSTFRFRDISAILCYQNADADTLLTEREMANAEDADSTKKNRIYAYGMLLQCQYA
jgi:hypothetical protein